jgi:predicted amino acid racemase
MPRLLVDVEAIGRNTEAVAGLLREHDLDLVAVTKGCLGEPRVAAAMLAGGAVALADTRDLHLRRLRTALPGVELNRICLPPVADTFEPGDVTYVSSREGAEAVAALGNTGASGPVQGGDGLRRVMLSVETGDEREGVSPEHLTEVVSAIVSDGRLSLEGLATNYACFRGTSDGLIESVEKLLAMVDGLRCAGIPVTRVSGGNSSLLWPLTLGGRLPAGVTELRCGEALLLGQDGLHYEPLEGCRQDACLVRAELVEEYTRPTPEGPSRRLLLEIGRQDIDSGAVRFIEPGLRELGRSSDYLVVEAETGSAPWRVGTMVEMIPSYEALVAAWMSPYVELEFRSS